VTGREYATLDHAAIPVIARPVDEEQQRTNFGETTHVEGELE
jgi:hypothetical protein